MNEEGKTRWMLNYKINQSNRNESLLNDLQVQFEELPEFNEEVTLGITA